MRNVKLLITSFHRMYSVSAPLIHCQQMSDPTNGVQSAASGSPIAAADGMQQAFAPNVPIPAAGYVDFDIGPTQTSAHAIDSKMTQVCFHDTSTTSVNEASIQGGSQQQLIRTSRPKPTSFPEPLITCRYRTVSVLSTV